MSLEGKKKGKYVSVGKKGAIKIGKVIGEGSQSKIFKGFFNERFVAVKSIMSREGSDKEVEILRKLDHPNIIRILFTDISYPTTFMALELCKYTLKEYVEDPEVGNILEPLEVLKEITEGLHYLHDGQTFCTVHRDLKPSNILFQYVGREKLWRVKISDFGISKELSKDKTSTISSLRGTIGYTAPELLGDNKGKIRKETDMFSLGVIFYYTLSNGKHPFGNKSMKWESEICTCEPCLDELKSKYPDFDIVESLILSLLQKNYQERPTVSEVKSHHIFWNEKKKLDFLQEASNYMNNRMKHQALINKLEDCHEVVTGGKKWIDVICSDAHNREMKKVVVKRKYEDKVSLQDLLRLIRNWACHYTDINTTDDFRAELGEYPIGVVNFFTSYFPKLLPCVYEIMMTQTDFFKQFHATEEMPRIEEKAEALLGATCVPLQVDADSEIEEESDDPDYEDNLTSLMPKLEKEGKNEPITLQHSSSIASGQQVTTYYNISITGHNNRIQVGPQNVTIVDQEYPNNVDQESLIDLL